MPVMYVLKILLAEDQNNTSLIPRLSPTVTVTHFSILQAAGGWAGCGIETRAIQLDHKLLCNKPNQYTVM